MLTAPIEAGEAEIRYMTGSQARVLARRSITITAAAVTIEAADEVVAGAAVKIVWTGPNNAADYLTIVAATTPEGQYGNYTNTAKGSPLVVRAPMRVGAAEIRYMTGQGAKVLARRPIMIVPAQIEITAPAEAAAGSTVTIEWKGPNNTGDYLTAVPKTARDGVALHSAAASRGSPAKLVLPKETGVYEIRYMSGQGNLVLARREIAGR
jgi:Ca-activated chloride channel family protein